MPFSSHQVNSLMTGQSAMFGNVTNFAGSIGPEGRGGAYASAPAMYDPAAFTMPPPMYDVYGQHLGPRVLGAGVSIAQSALPVAALAGSFLPGVAGKAFSMMDPTYAAMSGFFRGSGLMSGVASGSGLMGTAEGILGNAGRIASGGFGNMARAGLGGLGAGLMAAAPAFMATQAIGWGAGQMMEGAQHTSHVQDFLQKNMRFTNPMSRTGFGFNRSEGADIAKGIRDVARSGDSVLTNTSELTAIMEQGVQGGLFKAVQDAETFKKKFAELTKTLKVVAKTMNTTLAGAMPFLAEARKMGFWSPSDVMAASTLTRGAATQTGMSVAATQEAMGQGAAMARSVGASGAAGALGMQRTLSLVGGGMRSGAISEQTLQEATGLQGPEAIQAFSQTLQAGATRFASSRTGRWMLASLANKGFTGFDKEKLSSFMSGGMGVGSIQSTAEKNVSGHGNAAKFLMGEESLRGEMLAQGPMGQVAFIRGALGDKLNSTGDMDKYVTRRMIQRFMGVNAKTADIFADLARNQPRIIRENAERELNQREAENRQADTMLNHSFGGLMRKIGHHVENSALVEFGAAAASSISDAWSSGMDRIWGRATPGSKVEGITSSTAGALRKSILSGGRVSEGGPRSRAELDAEMRGFASKLSGAGGGVSPLSGAMGTGAFSTARSAGKNVDLQELQGVEGFAEAARTLAAGSPYGMMDLLRKGKLSRSQKGAVEELLSMSQAGGETAKTLRSVMGGVAQNIDKQGDVAFAETMQKRMGSAAGQLGGREDYVLGTADAIKAPGKGGSSLGLGGLLKRLLHSDFDPGARKETMEKLIQQVKAGGAGAAEKLKSLLPTDSAEFAGIRGAIDMAGEAAQVSGIKNWGGAKGIGEIGRVLGAFGAGGFGKEEMGILRKGGKARDDLIDRTVSGLDSDRASAVRGLMGSLGGKDKDAAAGVSRALEKLAALVGMNSDTGLPKMKGLKDSELGKQLGGRGSMEGIHDTLTRMLSMQEAYYSSEQGGKFQYAPAEKPPENSSHA